MPRMKSFCAALALSLVATSCAAPMTSTMPVVAVESPTDEQISDGVAPTEYHGIPGLFFTFEAWRNVLIKVRLERKDLELALAEQTIGREVAEIEAKRLRESQAKTQWAATFGPWLGFAGGLTVAGILAGILGGVLK